MKRAQNHVAFMQAGKMDQLEEDTYTKTSPAKEISGASHREFPVSAEYIRLQDNKKEIKASCLNFQGPVFEIIISLEGEADVHLKQKNKNIRLTVSAGMFFLCLNQGHSSCKITTKAQGSGIVRVFFSHDSLFSFIGVTDLSPVHPKISTKEMASGIVQVASPQMNRIIADLFFLIKNKKEDKMYLTLKALELLWVCFSSDFSKSEKNINSDDLIAIRKSVVMLTNNMGSPPGLNELAKAVGMSASKFKILFPRIYGMPPYEYLRKKKMEKAMYLLFTSEMNVTEVAMEVGYNSLSHFSKAFFKAYKVKPSRVRRQSGESNCCA